MDDVKSIEEVYIQFLKEHNLALLKKIYGEEEQPTEETTTTRDVDSIGAYTLEELFAMNGSKFPFSAVKVNTTAHSTTATKLPTGTVLTVVGHATPSAEGFPMYAESHFRHVVANNPAWQFADPDFDVKD